MLETLSITQVLAAFIGLYMVAAGIGLLTDRDGYATLIGDVRENTALGFVTSLFVFVLGAVIVALHNFWTDPLTILVSLIGWGALIEGVLLLAFRRPFLRLVGLIPFTSSTMVPFGIFAIVLGAWLLLAVGADPIMGAQISLSDRLNLLRNNYPDDIAAVAGNKLVLKNGKSFLIDDGIKKTHQEKLKNADIQDMFSQIYPLGACFKGAVSRNFNPGGIRNVSLMREIFGRSKQAVAKNLTSINWFGRSVRFTRVAGAGQALIRVRDELAKLAPKFRKYFEKSAGTFHWRVVAGTKRLSQHSFGSAIDINTKFGDYWRWSGGKPGKVPKFKNRIPMEIVEIFERHGFIWGGKWYHYDTMHFSYRPEMIAIAELALKRGCAR